MTSKVSPLSDDEIFVGKLSLKEVKRHLFVDNYKSFSIDDLHRTDDQDCDTSLRLIETHSEPDLLSEAHFTLVDSSSHLETINSSDISNLLNEDPSDNSFIQIEKMVSNLCASENSSSIVPIELDNTLDVVDYILKHGPNHSEFDARKEDKRNDTPTNKQYESLSSSKTLANFVKKEIESNVFFTPTNHNVKKELDPFATPSEEMKTVTSTFKTPAPPLSNKKQLFSSKKTSVKSNAYDHITSPIASYIKNSPQVPLIKEVKPKKPLISMSAIPKPIKSITQTSLKNKENVILPALAYKSAKETKVIEVPDGGKLPQSRWAMNVVSSLPKPLVIKHNLRENNFTKKYIDNAQENSFADLSLHQADVSVCTQKSAISK